MTVTTMDFSFAGKSEFRDNADYIYVSLYVILFFTLIPNLISSSSSLLFISNPLSITVLVALSTRCGQWSQISYSAECNVENRAEPIMVCQDTCVSYSNTQKDIVSNPEICASSSSLSNAQFSTRNETLLKDYTDCTDWKSLVSTNNATCVEGIENEGNCGFGNELSDQLCAFCDPSGNNELDECCYDSKTDLKGCRRFGHPNAALVNPTMSVPPQIGASSTSTSNPQETGLASNLNQDENNDDTGLSKGQLAGIIVGSILGALLLGALLTLFLMKKRNAKDGIDQEARGANGHANGNGVYSNIAPVAAAATVSNEKGWNTENISNTNGHGANTGGADEMMEKSKANGAGAGAGAGALAGVGVATGISKSNQNNPSSSPLSQSRPISSLSASSGTDGRGTTVPFVRDQYSGHDILPGESVLSIYPYNASLNDELTLELEDRITVARLYDDGWALGTNVNTGQQGAFPLVCVTSEKGDAPLSRAGNGTSVTGTSGTDVGTEQEDNDGMTSNNDFTSDAEGAVTADEGYTSASSRRR